MAAARRRAIVRFWAGPALMFGAVAGATLPAVSRGLETSERTAREISVIDASGARQLPFAGFSIYHPTRREWTVFTLYMMFREASDGETRRRESYWLGRRVAGNDARKSAESPEWASSDRCPALDAAVRSMGDVMGERLEALIPDQGDASEAESDPTQFRIWTDAGRFRGTGHAASIAVSAGAGSPAAEWIQESAAAIAGCWTGDAPVPVRPAAR